MADYYIHNGKEQQGPFKLEDLKEKKISKDISVWREGMTNWEKAGNVDELKDLFAALPPPFIPLPPPFIKTPPPFNKTPPPFINSESGKEINPNNQIKSNTHIATDKITNTHGIKIKIASAVIILLVIVGLINVFIEDNPSSCDCANLYENSPMNKNYSAEELNDGSTLRNDADAYVKKAKKCAIKYGNLSDIEVELAKSTLEMNMIPKLDQAIQNAKKECAHDKKFNNEQLESACDCWNQSYEKSGMEFDRMNSDQQEFRNKCYKLFGDVESMKAACEQK